MNSPPALHILPDAVAPHFGRAMGGIWRLTLRRVFSPVQLLIGVILLTLLALLVAVSVRPGNAGQFFEWVVRFHLLALVPVSVFLSGAGAIRDDMKGVAVDYILTRPVRRTWYVFGKYACHTGCLIFLHLVALAALVGVGVQRGVPDVTAAVPALTLALIVAVAAFTAFGFLCGAVTSRYLVLGLVYGFVVEVGLSRIPIQLNKLSVLHHLKTLLADVAPEATGSMAAASSPAGAVAMVGLYIVVWMAAAAMLFSLQEFAGQRPKEG